MSLKDFFKLGKERQFGADELVLRGDGPTGVFYIQSGFVKVYSISDSGDRYLHIIYRPGEIFPLIWALLDVKRRIFYEAASKITIWEVSRDDFLTYLKGSPQGSYSTLLQLAEQFNVYADRLDNLQYKPAPERVAYRLLFLAARFGKKSGEKIIIKAPITHELIAESVNLARETVSRELENLEKRGLLARDHHQIVINDINKLAEEFSEPISLNLWGLK